MTSTEKAAIRIAEEQVLEFYEKYDVPLNERKNFNETGQKAISNNLPELTKAVNKRRQRKYLYIASFVAIIISITFWYWIIINILK